MHVGHHHLLIHTIEYAELNMDVVNQDPFKMEHHNLFNFD